MRARRGFRWRSPVLMALGVWVALSPWFLGYADTHVWATYGAVTGGVALVAIEALALDSPGDWADWLALVVGLWLILGAFLGGLAGASLLGKPGVGAVVTALAAWALWTGRRA